MTATDHDRDLEHLLRDDGGEWGALYRKLSRVEPPRRLDRNVLGEAARAVHGRAPRRQRWLVGLSSAAGVVFAAGIAWHIGHDALRNPTLPAPPTASRPQSDARYVPVEAIHTQGREAESAAAPAPATPAMSSAAVPAPAPPPAPAAPARSPEPFPKAEAARSTQKAAATPTVSARGAAMSPAASVAPAAPLEQAAPAMEEVVVGADAISERGAAAASAAAAAAATTTPRDEAGASTATQLLRSAELRNDMRLAPADWIRRIRWLLEQGRREQAVESLQLLRRVHPDLALPADLQALQ